ncbi:MAG TPA: capsule assembly Wzi family protein [Longimicrobiales bacterium]
MSRSRTFLAFALGAPLLSVSSASAQSAPGAASSCTAFLRLPDGAPAGVYADYARTAELAGAAPLRPWVIRRPAEQRRLPGCEDERAGPWRTRLPADSASAPGELRVELVPPKWRVHINSAYPTDRNDGALWPGRGVATSLRGGVIGSWDFGWGTISATLAPAVLFHENRDFEIRTVKAAQLSPFAYPWHHGRIDWPQRFGESAFWVLDPGQSQLRINVRGWTLGLSNENLWWGPALRYPLLMSNTAPGFPHVFTGTSRPLATPIGRIEGRLQWGWLRESDYFDVRPENDRRMFAGIVMDYEPRWLPGLFLGFARAYLVRIPEDGLEWSDYFTRPYANVRSNPLGNSNPLNDNQIISLFARWAFPEVGFEAYAEWAREDHWEDLDDLLMEPDHAQAYMLGFQKVVPGDARWIRLYGELAHLQSSTTFRSRRPPVTFYTHTPLVQGYTHRGQLLGAAIGPGSDAQLIGVDVFGEWGLVGLHLERVRRDNDAYYETWARYYGYRGHDVELTAGVRHHFFDGDFDIGWGLTYSTRKNRNFIGLDGFSQALRVETNWALDLEVAWSPGVRRTRRPATLSTRADER